MPAVHRAHIRFARNGWCRPIGASEWIEAIVGAATRRASPLVRSGVEVWIRPSVDTSTLDLVPAAAVGPFSRCSTTAVALKVHDTRDGEEHEPSNGLPVCSAWITEPVEVRD